MSWNDDRWKDSYDAWKLATPYDDYPEPEEECHHEACEINSEGRAICQCGEEWWATADEIACERERNALYDAYMRREERMEKYWRPLRRFWLRVLAKVWRPKPKAIDDEIPF